MTITGHPFHFSPIVAAIVVASCSPASGSVEVDADALPRLALVEELRIGSAGSPDTGFSTIGRVEVDRDGNVFVGERQQRQIRVYDPRGRLMHSIGRRGQGPGEFQNLPSFGVVGDTVWTFELAPRRLTLFDRRGTVLSTVTIEGVSVNLRDEGAVGITLPTFMRADGVVVGEVTLQETRPFTGTWPIRPTDTVALPRVTFGPSGKVMDTIGWNRIPPPRRSTAPGWITVGQARYRVPTPVSISGAFYSLRDGRVTVDVAPESPTFSVTRFGLAGDTVYHRRFRHRPRAFDRAMLDSLAWRSVRSPAGREDIGPGFVRRVGMQPDSMAAFDAVRAAMRFPTHQLPVSSVDTHDDGAIWLRREDDGSGPFRWMVLALDGIARGEVSIPRTHRVAWARDDTVWMIEPDDNDVPWLVRYRITTDPG